MKDIAGGFLFARHINSTTTVASFFIPAFPLHSCSPRESRKICLHPYGIYVNEFKYLGHIINNDERDDKDVLREVRAMFTRTNILARRFSLCSVSVKIALLDCFVSAFMEWNCGSSCYTACAINRLRSCYIKCMKTYGSLNIQNITV